MNIRNDAYKTISFRISFRVQFVDNQTFFTIVLQLHYIVNIVIDHSCFISSLISFVSLSTTKFNCINARSIISSIAENINQPLKCKKLDVVYQAYVCY
jgi:hypothetical protein